MRAHGHERCARLASSTGAASSLSGEPVGVREDRQDIEQQQKRSEKLCTAHLHGATEPCDRERLSKVVKGKLVYQAYCQFHLRKVRQYGHPEARKRSRLE